MNAFDEALVNADIAEANLVPVSSVLPRNIKEVKKQPIERGTITFCVLSRMEGVGGEVISAGLAYARRKDGSGGYVAEGHLHGKAELLRIELESRSKQMAAHRGIVIDEVKSCAEELHIPQGKYGSCVVALIFLF